MTNADLLTGRVSRCGGKDNAHDVRPSTDALTGALAFFEYRGPGSDEENLCVCGFHQCAHDPEYVKRHVRAKTVVEDGLCTGFRSRGPSETDSHYCGCRGWD